MLEFLSTLGLLFVGWSVWYGWRGMSGANQRIDYQRHDDLLRSLTPEEKTPIFAMVKEATEHQAELPNGSKVSMRQVRYWS